MGEVAPQEGLNWMVSGKKVAGVGAIAAGLMLAGFAWQGPRVFAQSDATQNSQTTQQQTPNAPSVPNAPRPQTLPQLNTLTPVGPSIPGAPPPANAGAPAKDDEMAPSSSLPASPTSTEPPPDQAPPELPGPGQSASVYRLPTVPVNFVQIPFSVKNSKGQLVPGITWRDVRVYENGKQQKMALYTTDPLPLSVALVIDQSVTFDTMQKINDSLDALQGSFAAYDEVAVFTYNNGVREQTGFLGGQTARLGAILQRSKGKGREPDMAMGGPLDQTQIINNQIVDPNTTATPGQQTVYHTPEREYHTLNDAILAAAESLAHTAPNRLRIVYVISDGKEYGSKATQKEVIRYCQTNKVTVYGTLVGDSAIEGTGFLDRIHLPFQMRDNVLSTYTAATGSGTPVYGWRQGQIEKSFQKIMVQARNQYTVGYYSHEPILDDKFRSVDVVVLRPDLTVIAKKGYYPTPTRTAAPAPVTPSATP
jgi:VWFA-related protein